MILDLPLNFKKFPGSLGGLRLQEMWSDGRTDRQTGDSYIPPNFVCGDIITCKLTTNMGKLILLPFLGVIYYNLPSVSVG